MIKYIQCVRRKPELSIQDFRRQWAEYQELARAVATRVGCARFSVNTCLAVEQNTEVMLTRGTMEPYDGTIEFWLERGPDALSALEEPDAAADLQAMQGAQARFMDLPSCTFFFAAED